jgi:hypothetical protein
VRLRVHLDAVPVDNAPLVVAPGSHGLGPIPVGNVAEVVEPCGTTVCLTDAGDVWPYATLLLHASEQARPPAAVGRGQEGQRQNVACAPRT